jgi:phosphotransferase system IIB component
VFFAVYYFLFRFAITKWNMRTPGREPASEFGAEEQANLVNVDACVTRLRMEVADTGKVDQDRLKRLEAAGVIEGGNSVQTVFGTRAEALKNDIVDTRYAILREIQRALTIWIGTCPLCTTASPPNKVLVVDCRRAAATSYCGSSSSGGSSGTRNSSTW